MLYAPLRSAYIYCMYLIHIQSTYYNYTSYIYSSLQVRYAILRQISNVVQLRSSRKKLNHSRKFKLKGKTF